MPGIAATLDAGTPDPRTLTAMSEALAARGADAVTHRTGGAALLSRAAIPSVPVVGSIALVVDGIAEPTALVARYRQLGPVGLVVGDEPYALILATADSTRGASLVLARNGDGPPLYYATGPRGQVLAASEPMALHAAGVPVEPDWAVVERFLATGACDDTEATFFADIRRVLPHQVVEVTRAGIRTQQVKAAGEPASAQLALRWAAMTGRVGVRLGAGVAGAAALGAALARPDRPRPLPVYSTTFPAVSTVSSEYATLLASLSHGVARHRALPFFADEMDLDAFLADVGEPVPDLSGYLLWATARLVAGEVDALIDTAGSTGPSSYLSRLADRAASRFGVALRFPLRHVNNGGEVLRAELTALVHRTLPAASIPTGTDELPLPELLRHLRTGLAATLLDPRLPDGRVGLAQLDALAAGRRVDAPAVFRRYTVERWLRTIVAPAQGATPTAPDRPAPVAGWARHPIRTEVLVAGDRIPEKVAWYVAEHVTAPAGKPRGQWYVLLAGRAVAVAQGRAREVWDIRPSRYARLLSRLAGRRSGPSTPWAMQVALEVGGPVRLLASVLCGRTDPLIRAVREPRPDAVAPGPVAVTPPPVEPDRVAAAVLAALRGALPAEAYATLAGCAIMSGETVLGRAGTAIAPDLLARLCLDDPFGQGGERTPIVVVRQLGDVRPRGKASNQARTARSYAKPKSSAATAKGSASAASGGRPARVSS